MRLAEAANAPQNLTGVLAEPSPEKPIRFGSYELVRRIGAGGMGEVFLAREPATPHHPDRACVVKKVLPSLLENRAFVGRFLDESRVVVRLKHPNIARVYAMGENHGEYYLTMEYVQGKTVSRFTKRMRDKKLQLPIGLVLLLGEKVCTGLQYAHDAKDEQGQPLHLVHRDLSPANVCISYRGEVKIIDFGAAQSTLKEEQTAPRVVIGNLTYMAPEQAKKQLVDRRADVYSCGVMLWELLAWFALPQKGDPIERWRKAANPSWDPPSKHAPNVPAALDELVLKALKKDPKERFQSAAELGEALRLLRIDSGVGPHLTERDLGDALGNAFSKEKALEDQVLAELIGRTVGETTVETKRISFVPPTALAFEHTAVMAPAGILAGLLQDTTDPGEGPNARHIDDPDLVDDDATVNADDPRSRPPVPSAAMPPPRPKPVMLEPVGPEKPAPKFLGDGPAAATQVTRSSFGIQLEQANQPQGAEEISLIQEIEAHSGEGFTTPFNERRGFGLLAVFVFLGAVGLGFLAIYIWSRFS